MKTNAIQIKHDSNIKNLNNLIGIIDIKGDSVEQVRKIRKILSKQKFDLDEINKLAD